ncbi:MAG: hypothetical protein ACQKBV_06000 [Puniceicoccales bacterium]
MANPAPVRIIQSVFIALLLMLGGPLAAQSPSTCSLDFKVMLFTARTQLSAGAIAKQNLTDELPDLYYQGPEGYAHIDLQRNQMTAPYPYTGTPELTLYLRKVVDEKPVYQPAFNVEFGLEWTSAIIVLISPEVGQQNTRVFAVNTSSENIPEGNIVVYNLSPQSLVMNANEEIYPLDPLSPVQVPIASIKNNVLPVALALKDNDGYELVYRRKWSMRPTISGVYFLFALNDDYRRWYMKNIIL